MKNYLLRSINFKVFSRIKENPTNNCDVLSSQHLLGAAVVTTRPWRQKPSHTTACESLIRDCTTSN